MINLCLVARSVGLCITTQICNWHENKKTWYLTGYMMCHISCLLLIVMIVLPGNSQEHGCSVYYYWTLFCHLPLGISNFYGLSKLLLYLWSNNCLFQFSPFLWISCSIASHWPTFFSRLTSLKSIAIILIASVINSLIVFLYTVLYFSFAGDKLGLLYFTFLQ